MDRFALTDTNALYGFVFYRQICAETGLTPIAGAEVVEAGDGKARRSPRARAARDTAPSVASSPRATWTPRSRSEPPRARTPTGSF